jgi:hypothetical protein
MEQVLITDEDEVEVTYGGSTLHPRVSATGDVPLLTLCTQRPLYSEGSSANRTSSAHCLELSTVTKQWHRNIQGDTALGETNRPANWIVRCFFRGFSHFGLLHDAFDGSEASILMDWAWAVRRTALT